MIKVNNEGKVGAYEMSEPVKLTELTFNAKSLVKKNKSKSHSIISQLDDFEDMPSLSSLYIPEPDVEREPDSSSIVRVDTSTGEIVDDRPNDDWAMTLSSFIPPKTKKRKKGIFEGIDLGDGKKKKKKDKKKDGGAVNHKKEFEPEMALLRNLQYEQNKFTDSLQKKYDAMESQKGTARGVSKFTTDLIISITQARSLSMQLVDKIISTKKTIADLDFKERKEFGSQAGSEQQNLNNYASTYLKQVMAAGRGNLVAAGSSPDVYDVGKDDDVDDLFDSISDSLSDEERDGDIDKYLKYENDGIQIHVVWHDNADDDDLDAKYEFEVYTKDGTQVFDYPLPEKTKMSINRTNGTATDMYGNRYKLVIED